MLKEAVKYLKPFSFGMVPVMNHILFVIEDGKFTAMAKNHAGTGQLTGTTKAKNGSFLVDAESLGKSLPLIEEDGMILARSENSLTITSGKTKIKLPTLDVSEFGDSPIEVNGGFTLSAQVIAAIKDASSFVAKLSGVLGASSCTWLIDKVVYASDMQDLYAADFSETIDDNVPPSLSFEPTTVNLLSNGSASFIQKDGRLFVQQGDFSFTCNDPIYTPKDFADLVKKVSGTITEWSDLTPGNIYDMNAVSAAVMSTDIVQGGWQENKFFVSNDAKGIYLNTEIVLPNKEPFYVSLTGVKRALGIFPSGCKFFASKIMCAFQKDNINVFLSNRTYQ